MPSHTTHRAQLWRSFTAVLALVAVSVLGLVAGTIRAVLAQYLVSGGNTSTSGTSAVPSISSSISSGIGSIICTSRTSAVPSISTRSTTGIGSIISTSGNSAVPSIETASGGNAQRHAPRSADRLRGMLLNKGSVTFASFSETAPVAACARHHRGQCCSRGPACSAL